MKLFPAIVTSRSSEPALAAASQGVDAINSEDSHTGRQGGAKEGGGPPLCHHSHGGPRCAPHSQDVARLSLIWSAVVKQNIIKKVQQWMSTDTDYNKWWM